ncbi:glutaredoxin domain-containing protein [Tenacibaculum sp. HL-MS23]|mgnify:FL=1|uniref:glutaredoxin family protein n=1 Tax=Tenacibaculum sp. HL-MS23 TaxID=3077734 RepID=UPI0028FC2710|nr:glutaredoxin domain-containing protein [Tenacibaculum sp. HL-MS23]WNW02035.1 glutaredoxin domain-containing protein [Tenacibaculum sp. HL-MS23]
MKIVIYGRKGHAHTVAFKNYLRMADIPFEYKDVTTDEKAKQHTKELYDGVLKYPTLFINDEVYLTPTSDDFNKILKEASLKG